MSEIRIHFEIDPVIHLLIKTLHTDERRKNKEWSALGRMVKADGCYKLVDLKFPEQTNSVGLTDMTEDGVSKVQEELFEADPESAHEWSVWVHSHHSMSVFWSGTDVNQRNAFDNGNRTHYFSIVTGYAGGAGYRHSLDGVSYKGVCDFYKPKFAIDADITIGELPAEFSELSISALAKLKSLKKQRKVARQLCEETYTEQNLEAHISTIKDIINTDVEEEVLKEMIIPSFGGTKEKKMEEIEEIFTMLEQSIIKEDLDLAMEEFATERGINVTEKVRELAAAEYKAPTVTRYGRNYKDDEYDYDEYPSGTKHMGRGKGKGNKNGKKENGMVRNYDTKRWEDPKDGEGLFTEVKKFMSNDSIIDGEFDESAQEFADRMGLPHEVEGITKRQEGINGFYNKDREWQRFGGQWD